jgi:glycerate kinase
MSAMQGVDAMCLGVMPVVPDAECVGVPMPDGGKGSVDAVIDALDGQRVVANVEDTLGRPTSATYGLRSATAAGCDRDRCSRRNRTNCTR